MKRILFVDDEPNILQGLKRMLRKERAQWDMSFASSGKEALVAMDGQDFDAIITDMKMPGMDGAQLLEQVAERSPRTLRIVLSGHADRDAAMRSVGVSHQFLAKPCDAESVKRAMERVAHLDALVSDPKVQEAIGSISDLPPLPAVFQQLNQALARDDVEITEIGEIAQGDVGIAAKILQLVNSSYFGISGEITDLVQATTYLGINTIRDLVLAFGLFQQFEARGLPAGFSLEAERDHALLTARIAKRMFSARGDADRAFLAAMLHDVGKLVLATRLPEALHSAISAGAGTTRPFHEVEAEQASPSHSAVGAYLLGLWGMPYPTLEAVAHHHNPQRAPQHSEFGILAATHVADALAHEQGGQSAQLCGLDETYLQGLGVLNQLPEWRQVAAEEAGGHLDAA